jgi:hypothetical protein
MSASRVAFDTEIAPDGRVRVSRIALAETDG